MARRLNDGGHRTTDHTEEINALHEQAIQAEAVDDGDHRESLTRYGSQLRAVAALLAVHDATGLTLDDWPEVGNFVNDTLGDLDMGPFMPHQGA